MLRRVCSMCKHSTACCQVHRFNFINCQLRSKVHELLIAEVYSGTFYFKKHSQHPKQHANICFLFPPEARSFFFSPFSVLFHCWIQKAFVTLHLLGMNKIRENKWRSYGLSNTATLQRLLRWKDMRGLHSVSWTLVAVSNARQQLLGEKPRIEQGKKGRDKILEPGADILASSSPLQWKPPQPQEFKWYFHLLSWPVCCPILPHTFSFNAGSLILELLLRGCFVFCSWTCDSLILIAENICSHN